MNKCESELLAQVLLYEQGHKRRVQHILKVYALVLLLEKQEELSLDEQTILHAAAIVHDLAIKYCKEHFNGDACQDNQKKVAPKLVTKFLKEANYDEKYIEPIIELVLNHHDYDHPRNCLLQLLIEADLIINSYETSLNEKSIAKLKNIFVTTLGKKLFLQAVINN